MRILAGLSIGILFTSALFAQHAAGRAGGGGFRGGGGGFHPGGPGLVGSGRRVPVTLGNGAVIVPYVYPVYGYPVYIGNYAAGYTDGSYAAPPDGQQPNVTVVYPPQPGPAMLSQFGPGGMPPPGANPEPVSPYEPSTAQADSPDHYLIALKDHTIYSVVAYWVEGDTLHYFTAGNVHNQASLSLVDRDLTTRLNKESGLEVNLPPAK